MEYFISDFHFGHKAILGFERFEFETIEQHDDYIMKMLEHKLTKNDKLYFLGDMGWMSDDIWKRWINLPCYKIMICGNHDERSPEHYKDHYNIDEVYNHPLYISKRIVLSHIPIPVTDGVINIHGHLHGMSIDKINYINVSACITDYQLISLKQVEKKLCQLPKDNEKFLDEWYAEEQVICNKIKDKRGDLLLDSKNKVVGFTSLGMQRDQERRLAAMNRILKGKVILYHWTKWGFKEVFLDNDKLLIKLYSANEFEVEYVITEIEEIQVL